MKMLRKKFLQNDGMYGCEVSVVRIIFVRHGHPNYQLDCLTELGRAQAQAAAHRIADEGISEIFSSTCGRALETAGYTANLLGLPIVPCDFMREIKWASKDGTVLFRDGNPWFIAWDTIEHGKTLLHKNWQQQEPFCHSSVVDHYAAVSSATDQWLLEQGYRREGEYYRVVGESTNRTVAMFSHGGSSSVALSHMSNIPFPYFCGALPADFTAVTIPRLSDQPGSLTGPRFEVVNDAHHIRKCAC